MEHPHDLILCTCRVGKRAKDIEYRAHAQFLAHRCGVLHSTMVAGSEHEPQADFADGAPHLLGGEVDTHPQCLEHVSAAGLTGYRSSAMLGDLGPGRGRNES